MLQCYHCKSWVHYECTQLPNYTLVSLENPRRRFSCKYCVKIPDTFLQKMKQISSSTNSSKDSSSKASIDKLSQLQAQIETLNDEKTVLQNTIAQKEVCIDGLNKEKIEIQDTLTQKEEHIETLQERITELQDERKFMTVQTKQLRTEIKEASEENILKPQTIDNLESKQQNVNQYIQKLNVKIKDLKTDLKNSKTNSSNKNDKRAAELEEGITITAKKSENTTELERKINELEQINSSLKDNKNKIDETLNIKSNELAKALQDLTPHKEKSESEKKDFQNKLKMLREENNDFRNKNNQLHETLKMKINDLKEAEECIQYLIEKSKQVFQNEHHNDHSYTSCSQRPDEQVEKNVIKTNHTSPTNQISSNNHSGHRQTNQLMPESSSTNHNSRIIPAQTETSTIVIPKTTIGRIIERKGNKIEKMQSQNNVEIKIGELSGW